jgi:phosphoribosyl-AMP cyclohydrolase
MPIDPSSLQFGTRDSKETIEHGLAFAPKFDDHGLIVCVTLDAATKAPLMVAYMNEESLKQTLAIGEAVYYSRSRKELWHKGATSGQIQKVVEMRTDCDQDALVLYVKQMGGGCCHTGADDCFYRKVETADLSAGIVPLIKG